MKRMVDGACLPAGQGWWVVVLASILFLFNAPCFAEKTADPNAWDFGKLKQGEVAIHKFILKNESSRTLNITGVNTSCGCALAEVKKKTLTPREAVEVEVRFNSQGYAGPVQQFAYVNTDDVDKPVIRFIIKANVIK